MATQQELDELARLDGEARKAADELREAITRSEMEKQARESAAATQARAEEAEAEQALWHTTAERIKSDRERLAAQRAANTE